MRALQNDEKETNVEKPNGLTQEELVVACANIGFDLTCGECACRFFTGHGGVYPHDARCFTPKPVPGSPTSNPHFDSDPDDGGD